MYIPPCVYSQFSVVVREHDEIFHISLNECLEIIAILQCLFVIEEKSCRRCSLSRDDNLPLKFEKSAMKISKLLSVLEFHSG